VLGWTERRAGRRRSASDEGEGRSGGLCTGGEFGGWSSSRRKWRTTWARPRVPHRPRHGRLQNTELASWRRSPQRSWTHRTQVRIHNRATHQITHRATAPRIHCRQHHDDFVASLPQRSRWPSVLGVQDRRRRSSQCGIRRQQPAGKGAVVRIGSVGAWRKRQRKVEAGETGCGDRNESQRCV
jgi:hypothetical protein